MAKRPGEQVLLYVDTNPGGAISYSSLGSEKTLTLTRGQDAIDGSDKASNLQPEKYPGNRSWNISADGLWVDLDAAFNALETGQQSGTAAVRVKAKTLGANMYTGSVIVTTLTITAAKGDMVQVTIALEGASELVEAVAA